MFSQSVHEDSSDEEAGWEEGTAVCRGDGDVGVSNDLSLRPRTHSFSSASSGEADGEYNMIEV